MFNIVVNGEVVGNGNTYQVTNNIFSNNTNIIDVDLNYISFKNNSMDRTFFNCTNLINVTNVNQKITNMDYAFGICINLVNAPIIPNSVTNMWGTFDECYNLVNAPVIPNSVINMYRTFEGCINLVNVPEIPNSVVDMSETFERCSNLVNVPVIPNSVTNMYRTFYNCINLVDAPIIPNSVTNVFHTFKLCTNLTGDIIIHSENIANAYNCFEETTLEKNVYIPCSSTYEYASGLYAFYNSLANYKTYYTDHNIEYNEGMVTVYDSSGNVIDGAYAWIEEDKESPMQFVLIVGDPAHGTYGGEYQFKRDSSKDVIEYIPAGGVSKTYKSFLKSGYSATNRVNGVLIFDINGNPIP